MTVPAEFLNVEATITRPGTGGRGGAAAGPPTVVASNVPADFQPEVQRFRSVNGEQKISTGVYRMDLGPDVQEGDRIEHGGRPNEEIVRVRTWDHGLETDHLEVRIGRSGVTA